MNERRNQANPRAAAYAAEGFILENRMPEERPYRAWQFYYKHCAIVSTNPYPNRNEYECSDPR